MLGTGRAVELLATLPLRLPALFIPVVQEFIAIVSVSGWATLARSEQNGQRSRVRSPVADKVQDVAPVDPGWVLLRTAAAELLELEQRDHLVHPDEPWTVKGTRIEIADFFDYTNPDGYRGDSIEVFLPCDPADPTRLAHLVDQLLDVFDNLRASGEQTTTYFALRSMAATRATLGLARWPAPLSTCSVGGGDASRGAGQPATPATGQGGHGGDWRTGPLGPAA